jgi:centromere protein C
MNVGVRRSSREPVKPLEYWRLEKIVYERRSSGPQPHYGMKDVIRIPKEAPKALSRVGQRSGKAGSRLKSIKEEDEDANDYAGWDDTTDPEGTVFDHVTQEEVRRRIAFTSAMVNTKPVPSKSGKPNSEYRFQKIFTDGEFMAGGLLEIPVNHKKPLKPARDNTYVRSLALLQFD